MLSAFLVALVAPLVHAAPAPTKDMALEAIWQGQPFSVPADTLRKAAPDAPADAAGEVLWMSVEYAYDAEHRLTRRQHFVVRVLTAEGIEAWGTLRFGWAPWHEARPVVKARVVTADGRELKLDPQTLSESTPNGDPLLVRDSKELIAPLPGVGRGATIEVTSEVRSEQKVFQTPGASGRHYFVDEGVVRKMRVAITSPAALAVAYRAANLPKATETTAGGTRRVEVVAAPTLWGPTVSADRVGRLTWSTGGSWQAMAQSYLAIVDKARTQKVPAGALTASGTRRDKIDKLLADLRARVRYTGLELGASAVVPYPPAEVWRREYGDCKDMAVMLVDALEAAGIEARVALLEAGIGSDIDPELPGLDLFDHVIVYVPASGAEPALWIDPTATGYGAGTLPMPDIERFALVVDAQTTAPIKTGSRAENPFVYRSDVRVKLALFGKTTVTQHMSYSGAGAALLRGRLEGLDRKQLIAAYEPDQKRNFGGALADVKVKGLSGTGAVELTLDVTDADQIGAGWAECNVALPGYEILAHLPFDARANDGDTFKVRTAFDVASSATIEAPPGYVLSGGVGDETITLGPVTFKQSVAKVPGKDNVATAALTLSLTKLDWTAAETAEFKAALETFMKAPKHTVVFRHGATALINSGSVEAGLSRFREELQKTPKDAATRARMAIALSDLGLGEIARAEVERALKDAPDDQLVLWAASIARSADMLGRLYVPGWDRPGSIALLRKLVKLHPSFDEGRRRLAQALTIDARGRFLEGGPEVDEAIAIYRKLAIDEADEASFEPYALALWRAERSAALADEGGELGTSARTMWLASVARAKSPAEAMRAASKLGASEQQQALEGAYGLLLAQRQYPAARALADAILTRFPGAQSAQQAQAVIGNLAPRPTNLDPATPEGALLALIDAISADVSGPGVVRAIEQATARAHWRPGETGELTALFLRGSSFDQGAGIFDFGYDLIWHHGKRTIDAAGDSGWRLRVDSGVGTKSVSVVSFWARGKSKPELVALGPNFTELGERARLLALAGDLAAARQWLDWARESLTGLMDKIDLTGVWPPVGEPTRASILAAAVWFAAQASHPHPDALAAAVPLIASWPEAARMAVMGSLARAADAKALLAAIDSLPSRNNETELVRVSVMARLGRYAEAKVVAEAKLAADPGSKRWALALADIAMGEGDVPGAAARLQPLVAAGMDSASNNYAWYQLFIERATEETERIAQRAVEHATKLGGDVFAHAALNTLTMIQLERGRWPEAVATLKRTISDATDVTPADWLLIGRLAEGLGYPELAKKSYARVPKEDDAASSWKLAQKRLAKLRR